MTDRASLESIVGPVSRETFERLVRFEAEFRKWAATMNLAAPSTLPDVWRRHILDSAQLLPLAQGARRWIDLGSGGGFPGAVIAILTAEHADREVHLVESNGKKAGFLAAALGAAGVKARIHADRIDKVVNSFAPPDIVTARALASLSSLLEWCEPWLANGSRALFHKGRDYPREVEESRQHWRFDLIEHASVIEHGSVVLDISTLARRSDTDKLR